jgi:hypothetical protein
MPKPTKLKIGDIVFALIPDGSDCQFRVTGDYESFVANDPPDIPLHVHCGLLPDLKFGREVFDSGGVWSLHRGHGSWVVSLHSPVSGSSPYQLAVLGLDFCAGDIYVRTNKSDNRQLPFPMGYPLDQVLMVNLLSRGRGVLLHAFGVSLDDQGYVFAGVSGAGKSSLATLWEGQEGMTLLSDDRVIVRQREGRFWVYGTPWHGDARVASPDAVPLERIFLIQHANENTAVPLNPLDATSRLLVCSFPTFWDAEGMAFTLKFLDELSQTVPCYELGFVPDESVVDFVRCMT